MKAKTLVGIWLGTALTCLPLLNPQLSAAPLGTAFTYQGRLADGANPATGLYDFSFSLWDSVGPAGTQIGATLPLAAVPVTNGMFTTTLDFGAGVFDGNARWLAVSVKTNGAASYSALTPRQSLTASPYSLFAPSAGAAASATTAGTATTANGVANNAVTAAGIASGQVVKSLNTLHDAVTLAAGANATLANSGQTLTLSTPTDWHIGGNAGTSPGLNFIGTTDNQPLEFWVNNSRALRLEPLAGSANVIGGYSGNAAQGGAQGVAIGGGGSTVSPNTVAADFSTIGGGYGNSIATNAGNSTIGGGAANLILSNAYQSTIAGGFYQHIREDAADSTIGGGWQNEIQSQAYLTTIAGGGLNTVQSGATTATIGGGASNQIQTNAANSTIAGGQNNQILPFAGAAVIGGGSFNTNGGSYATVPGGQNNLAGGAYSFAAGQRAKAANQGAFVWADSQAADFSSTANNQFLIRAAGGVGIGITNPVAALDVFDGTGTNYHSGGHLHIGANHADGDPKLIQFGDADWVHIGENVSDDLMELKAGRFFFTTTLGSESGYVGIGTNNPQTALHVVGTVTADNFTGTGAGLTGVAQLSGNQNFTGSPYLDDHDLYLRSNSDNNHALGWYGSGKSFAGSSPDGPVLYGYEGGALGSTYSAQKIALTWDYNQVVTFLGLAAFQNNAYLNNNDLFLRSGDTLHGLGWYGAGKLFAGANVDGPVLYGNFGGALGSTGNGATNLTLLWDYTGKVAIDPLGLNNGALAPGLAFGNSSGEGISSKRTATGNQYGLDFYTAFNNRMSITSSGNVGINTTSPAAQLHVIKGGTSGRIDTYGGGPTILADTSTSDGVFAATSASQGYAIWGQATGAGGGAGVYGEFDGASGGVAGVYGGSYSTNTPGVYANGASASSPALTIGTGGIRVVGAGIGTSTAAFIHVATAANASGSDSTAINNSLCNGDPNAILTVTPNLSPSIVRNNHPIGVWYNTSTSKWVIFNQDAVTIPINAAFNVLVIKN